VCRASSRLTDVRFHVGRLTPSSSRPSRRWRGITVTSSISQRKATSVGMRPGLRGKAMLSIDRSRETRVVSRMFQQFMVIDAPRRDLAGFQEFATGRAFADDKGEKLQ